MPLLNQADGRTYAQFTKAPESPSAVPDNGLLYSKKDYGGTDQVELFYKTDAGVEYQLTPTSTGGGTTYDFVYDAGATPAGNVYNVFADLYAAAAPLQGIKRVFLQSNLTIEEDYVLSGWEFIGARGTMNSPDQLTISGGSFNVVNGSVGFRNCTLVCDVEDGIAVSFGDVSENELCFLTLENVTLLGPANPGSFMFQRVIGSTAKLIGYLDNVQDSWSSDGTSFVFSDLEAELYIRFSRITSAYFFGGEDNSVNVLVDQTQLPIFPPGGDTGAGISPFNNDNDSENFTWRRIAQYQQSVIDFDADLTDLEMYAGSITDLVTWNPANSGHTLRTLSTTNSQRAFDNINGSAANSFTIAHAADSADGDFWCPDGKDFLVSPRAGFRIVRDPVNNVWRVLVPNQVETYDLVYDSAASPGASNVFSDFDALVTAGSLLPGGKRVWLKTDLTATADFQLEGTWQFIGVDSSSELYGTRLFELDGGTGFIQDASVTFTRLKLLSTSTGFLVTNLANNGFVSCEGCNIEGVLAPVILCNTGSNYDLVLKDCITAGVAGVGVFRESSGSATIINSALGTASFKLPIALQFQFDSGTMPISTNNQIANWDNFETNAFVDGNGGWWQIWTLATATASIAPMGVNVLDALLIDPSASVTLASIAAPSNGRATFPLVNSDAGVFTLTLLHNSGTGLVGGRFWCPGAAPFVLAAGAACLLVYDTINSRWVVK